MTAREVPAADREEYGGPRRSIASLSTNSQDQRPHLHHLDRRPMSTRRGHLRVVEVERKRATFDRPSITGSSDAMTDAAAKAIERLIEIGRSVDERNRRERGSGT